MKLALDDRSRVCYHFRLRLSRFLMTESHQKEVETSDSSRAQKKVCLHIADVIVLCKFLTMNSTEFIAVGVQ